MTTRELISELGMRAQSTMHTGDCILMLEAGRALEALLRDKERLDWLDGEIQFPAYIKGSAGNGPSWSVRAYSVETGSIRDCIDEHLAHVPKEKETK